MTTRGLVVPVHSLGWLPDNTHVYFESERDGYAHLYSVSIDGGAPSTNV
jgi:Tol biopolymer transport system component